MIGVFLIPFDKGVISRPGSKLAPNKIKSYLMNLNFKNKEILKFFEIELENFDTYKAHQEIYNFIKKHLNYEFYVFIGGDHSITYATFKAINSTLKNPLIINIDKHFDIRDWSFDNISSGTSFSRLLDEKIIEPKQLIEIGIMDFYNSDYLFQKAKNYGFEFIKMLEIKKNFKDVIKKIEEKMKNFDSIYLSIDIDVMDSSICPGSSASSPFGLRQEEIFEIIDLIISSKKLKALDIVETNPLVDFDDNTSKFSALILAYIISQIK
ncbi:MAG: arginase family protein [candidate division WOR-3 bacterium]